MIWRIYVLIAFIGIFYCLGSAVYHLVHQRGDRHQLARMLTWRIVVTLLFFLSLFLAYFMGWAHPHGLGQVS